MTGFGFQPFPSGPGQAIVTGPPVVFGCVILAMEELLSGSGLADALLTGFVTSVVVDEVIRKLRIKQITRNSIANLRQRTNIYK